MRKTIKNIIFWTIVLALVGVVIYCGMQVVPWLIKDSKEQGAVNDIRKRVHELAGQAEEDDKFKFSHAAWDELKGINPDFLAYMAYDDEFISEPVVQGTDNEFYLYHWIDGSWGDNGTFFFDYTNEMDDTNLTIYGHNVFYTMEKRKMTAMADLVDQAEYDKHPEFNIWFEDRKARYLITNIFYWDASADRDFAFSQRNFDSEEEFNEYKAFIDDRNLIKANDELKYKDRFVSLQTCKELYGDMRIIFICKEISSEEYE